jgi:hypothetical protein
MPAQSKAQQRAAGAALAAKRGDVKKSSLKGASREMEKSMSWFRRGFGRAAGHVEDQSPRKSI